MQVKHIRVKAHQQGNRMKTSDNIHYSTTFGAALAITISYSINESILWAIIHGFFGWLYVIYVGITGG